MSMDEVKKFGKMCAADAGVKERVREIGPSDLDGLLAYGRKLGFDLTREDMLRAADDAIFSWDELSEDDLEKIAGGTGTMQVLGGSPTGVQYVGRP